MNRDLKMDRKSKRRLQDRARGAMVGYAFYRWESALAISTTILLTFLSFLFKDSRLVPDWSWIGWLFFGLLGECLLVYTSLTDPEIGRRVLARMLKDEFKPERLHSEDLKVQVEVAFDYRSRIEAAIRERQETVLKENLNRIANQVDQWLENIYNLAQRLDHYCEEKKVLDKDSERASQRICQLQSRLQMETDPKVLNQIEVTIEGMHHQLKTIHGLESTMERANLQLEHTLSSLGTIFAQTILIEAKDIEDGHAGLLRQEITEEIKELGYILAAMDEVYNIQSSVGRYQKNSSSNI